MKTFKAIDFFLQTALLVMIPLSFLFITAGVVNPGMMLILFGVVQLISLLIHLFLPAQPWKKKKWRRIHLIGTLLIIAIMLTALLTDNGGGSHDKDDKYSIGNGIIVIYMVIPAIFFSLLYYYITEEEWRFLRRKAPEEEAAD